VTRPLRIDEPSLVLPASIARPLRQRFVLLHREMRDAGHAAVAEWLYAAIDLGAPASSGDDPTSHLASHPASHPRTCDALGLSAADVAARLGVTKRAVTEAARTGRLDGWRNERNEWRFSELSIERWQHVREN
jgi:hypothetical protein